MSDDLLDRLRNPETKFIFGFDLREEAADRIAALEAEVDELKRENRWLRGNCDADPEGVHTIVSEGRYRFCAKCGETITPEKLRMAEVFAERDAARKRADKAEAEVAQMRGLLEQTVAIAQKTHDEAMEWAKVYLAGYDGKTDSLFIANAIRDLILESDRAALGDAKP